MGNEFSWNNLTTLIVALFSAVSSIVAIVLNNYNSIRLHQLEVKTSNERDIVQTYIKAAGDYARTNIPGGFDEYADIIYLYTDKKLWKCIDKINETVKNKEQRQEALIYIRKFCALYRKYHR